jgi:aminoglycoside/choline kinase family phosphotransferase
MTRPEAERAFPFDDYRSLPLPGDASTRRYFRLLPRNRGGQSRQGLPAGPLIRMVFEGDDAAAAGRNFMEAARLFRSLRCPVPAIVHADAAAGCFVLEDLGDVTLEQAAADADFPRSLYDRTVDLLVAIQSRSRGLEAAFPAIFSRRLGAGKIRNELGFLRTHGLENLKPLTGAEARTVDRAFDALTERVAALPRVLNHRDYHSRNIMVRGEAIALVDFQDALMASPFYDLASLLRDSYTTVPAAESKRLFARYFEAAREADVPVPEDAAHAAQIFDIVALQRNVKALGTFAYQGLVLGRRHFLGSIPRTLAHVQGNAAVAAPELACLPEILQSRLGRLA